MENKNWNFDSWAESYDRSVRDGNWIHENYDQALKLVAGKVVDRVKSRSQSMLDIGAGTGNLESLLTDLENLTITAIEPSAAMREKFKEKHRNIELLDGMLPDKLPKFSTKFDIITSTYVIHHVPFDKIENMMDRLCLQVANDGQILIVDPMFESKEFRENHVLDLRKNGYNDMSDEIEDEYFHSIDHLKRCFERNGFEFKANRLTFYIWIVEAKKLPI
jgi:SAM-dependent methyltransferase